MSRLQRCLPTFSDNFTLLDLFLSRGSCNSFASLARFSHHFCCSRTKQVSLKSHILAGTKEIMLDSSWWWHWDRFYSSEDAVISGKQAMLRNGKMIQHFVILRKQRGNFDFLNRQASNSIRFLRNRGHQGNQHQRGFNNSTVQSPFEGFVQPNHIRSDVLLRASLFTVAVSAQNITESRLMTFNP